MNNQNINELKNRDLDACAFTLYFLPNKIFSNLGNDYIKERKIYTLFICNIKGVRKYITTVYADEYQKTSSWYDLFSLLKKKGLSVILYAVIPNDNHIKEALCLSFPEIFCLYTPFETIFKLQKYFSCSYSNAFIEKIKKIFLAQDINEFNLKRKEFFEYSGDFPFVNDLVEKDFKNASKNFNLPFLLRKHIFSFYFMRDNVKRISSLSRTKAYFDYLTDLESLFIPNIISIEKYMYCPKKEWNQIISIIYKDNKDLIIEYL